MWFIKIQIFVLAEVGASRFNLLNRKLRFRYLVEILCMDLKFTSYMLLYFLYVIEKLTFAWCLYAKRQSADKCEIV